MRVSINLASVPFRRDRPILVASITAAVLMLGSLGFLISLISIERGQLAATREAIERLEAQARSRAVEQTRFEGVMRRPENAEVLERSLFLNSLIVRKGISWTRMFSDLEKTLPHNVRLINVRPSVTPQSQVLLEMTIGSESTEPVVNFLMKLEGSEVFGATYVHGSLPPSQTEPLFRYRVSVNYAQRF